MTARQLITALQSLGEENLDHVVKYSSLNNSINMETRFCIEYVNPIYPLCDDGSINVRYDRVLTLEQAEHDLTLILSFGGKILDLYMGNVVDGETGEWSPKPMIVDDDDWFTTDWLKSLESKWKPSKEQMEAGALIAAAIDRLQME